MICAECGAFGGDHSIHCTLRLRKLHEIALGALFAEWDYSKDLPEFVKEAINVHGEALGV